MALEFIAGCFGGCAGVAVGHPFDTIKVRLQTQDALNPRYRGAWHCISETVRTESVRGLYKGMSSPMAGVAVINGLVFGVHGNIVKRLDDPTAIRSQGIAGAGAGITQAFVVSPMELVKTRMQIQSEGVGGALRYKNPLHCLKVIMKTEGVKGVYRGQLITLMREIPGFTSYFTTYEYLVRKMSDENDEPSAGAVLMAGGLAGIASWVLAYPVDVLKSRLQADGMDGVNKYKGIMHCLQTGLQNEGPSFLSRGLSLTIIRAFPTNAATFTVVNWVMKLGLETKQSLGDSDAWAEVVRRGEILINAAAVPIISIIYPSIMQQQQQLLQLHSEAAKTFISNMSFA